MVQFVVILIIVSGKVWTSFHLQFAVFSAEFHEVGFCVLEWKYVVALGIMIYECIGLKIRKWFDVGSTLYFEK